MSENYTLIKSTSFCGNECDVYSNGNEVGMTAKQLGECLGYSDASRSIRKIIERNPYIENIEFSGRVKLTHPQGGTQETLVFTEDGIYEVTMLAKTKKAKEFRAFVRKLVKSLRKGETVAIGTDELTSLLHQVSMLTQNVARLERQQKALTAKQVGFIPPTVEDIEDYCAELGDFIDCERFIDYYESVGWVIGNGKPMKDRKGKKYDTCRP